MARSWFDRLTTNGVLMSLAVAASGTAADWAIYPSLKGREDSYNFSTSNI